MKPNRLIIYGLFDPDNYELRYIGKTTNKLNDRLSSHIWEASKSGRKNKRVAWIKSILNKEKRPIIEEIYNASSIEELNNQESFYISYFKFIGADLTNQQPGGEGQPPGYEFKKRYVPPKGVRPSHLPDTSGWNKGLKFSEESKKKMSIAHSKPQPNRQKKIIITDIITGEEKIYFSLKNAALAIDSMPSHVSRCALGQDIKVLKKRYKARYA